MPLTRISPGLVVEGVGALKVACALPPEKLVALKAAGEAAGEHGWMIPAERVTLTNPRQFARPGQWGVHSSWQHWEARDMPAAAGLMLRRCECNARLPSPSLLLAAGWADEVLPEAVRRTLAGLDCQPSVHAEARLARLLVCEPGCELPSVQCGWTAGSFAQLLVLLPSAYSGGVLHIRHGTADVSVNLQTRNAKSAAFAAFYSGG